MKLLTDDLRAHLGREATYTAPEALGAAAIRYFALAIGSTRPEYAGPDPTAPPTLICETNQYAGRTPDEDGYAGHGWDLDVPGTRLVRGGNRYAFHQPTRASDVLTVTWRLSGLDERTTAAGRAMLVVTSTATYRNQHGDLLAVNTETLLYVEAGA